MIWIYSAAMLLLLTIVLKLFGNWRSPAVAYCSSWFIGSLLIALLGKMTYGIGVGASIVYVGAAISFVVGVIIGQRNRKLNFGFSLPIWLRGSEVRVFLNLGLMLCILVSPWYFKDVLEAANISDIALQLRKVRQEQVDRSGSTSVFDPLRNVLVLVQFIAMLSAYLVDGTWWARFRVFAAGTLWLIMGLATGSKISLVLVPSLLVTCILFGHQKLKLIPLAVGVTVSAILFIAGISFMNYGYMFQYGYSADITEVLYVAVSYFFGGLIGMSTLIEYGMYDFSEQNPLRSLMYLVNALMRTVGLTEPFQLGYMHAPFTPLGPGLADGNVYTALFSYHALGGWYGVVLWSILAGLISGWVFRSFSTGRSWSLLVFPLVYCGAIFSIYSEQLFNQLMLILKLLLLLGVLRLVVAYFQTIASRQLGVGQRPWP